jgi:hypothetical protein
MYNEATDNNDQPDNDFQCHHIFPTTPAAAAAHGTGGLHYHHDARRPVPSPERLARRSSFSLFTPTNHDAIRSPRRILIRIATRHRPTPRGILLYCLQISSANLRPNNGRSKPTPPEPPADVDGGPHLKLPKNQVPHRDGFIVAKVTIRTRRESAALTSRETSSAPIKIARHWDSRGTSSVLAAPGRMLPGLVVHAATASKITLSALSSYVEP